MIETSIGEGIVCFLWAERSLPQRGSPQDPDSGAPSVPGSQYQRVWAVMVAGALMSEGINAEVKERTMICS
ncbi:hypothetical protein SKAU_G00186560 [Synaphobranchus kaupii]|uniref:Uncharacterized protein n=1 Tax=Synaphobranchus kaupii TaxID=118154 RepID=A0A9Q1FCV6_SYNKA|nr:hypothetical protein SKAU_G00186560 [Synaphobranchus kaupii]